MKKLIIKLSIILLLSLLPSCGEVELASLDASCSLDACKESWLCWSPGSPEHGKDCSNKCFVNGDNTRYCYIHSECM